MNNNLTSQAATMQRNGVPNDIITNLNPISLVIFIPIVDNFLYPALRKAGIKFTPIKRMAFGFILASMAMVGAAVIQVSLHFPRRRRVHHANRTSTSSTRPAHAEST